MNNPVWEWLVRSRLNAYQANQLLHGPSARDAGPGWCFDRFGQSSTELPDGRVVLIAGEHEDHYDPDFYIYNDVVVQHPDGCIDIFGYPGATFPPTDFHSATLVGNRIVIIGNLGHPEYRRPGTTPILVLDLATFTVASVKASGTPPGWIHEHTAILSEDGNSILLRRGKLDRGTEARSLVENIDDWRLHLEDWRWEKLTERRWPRWELRRKDGQLIHLFDFQQALWARQFPELGHAANQLTEVFQRPSLEEELGSAPDLALYERLYRPVVTHEVLTRPEDEYGVHRVRIEEVIVRYVEETYCIQITVEGELPQQTIDSLTQDLRDKLSALENTICELVQL